MTFIILHFLKGSKQNEEKKSAFSKIYRSLKKMTFANNVDRNMGPDFRSILFEIQVKVLQITYLVCNEISLECSDVFF